MRGPRVNEMAEGLAEAQVLARASCALLGYPASVVTRHSRPSGRLDRCCSVGPAMVQAFDEDRALLHPIGGNPQGATSGGRRRVRTSRARRWQISSG